MVDIEFVFQEAFIFDQPLNWDVAVVTDMSKAFWDASAFNQDLNSWDTSSVARLEGTFAGASSFNGGIVRLISGWVPVTHSSSK